MSDVEKICCYDRDNNDALIAALANSKNNDPMTAASEQRAEGSSPYRSSAFLLIT